MSRVWLSATNVFATISAVACAFFGSAASFKSRPVQNAAPAPRKMSTRSLVWSDETLIAATSSLSSSSVSALRRSGRFNVTIVIWGLCFSINTTGIFQRSEVDVDLNLNHAGVEMRFRHRAGNVLKQADQDVAGLVRLNDGVDPAACGSVANVGLFLVILFYLGTKLLEFVGRCFLVATITSAGEDRKHRIRCLRGAHHGVTRVWPRHDKSRVVCFAAHGIIPRAKRSSNDRGDFRHNGITDRVHEFSAAANNAALLCVASDHEAGDILEKDDRQTGLVAIHYETRGLIGTFGINNAAHLDTFFFCPHLQALVCHNADSATGDTRVRGHDSLAVIGLVFID